MYSHKKRWLAGLALFILAGAFLSYHVYRVNLAHTTFERYYAFRGCTKLLERTETYGDCMLANGQKIKIVLYEGKWYLDGDLPSPGGDFTF